MRTLICLMFIYADKLHASLSKARAVELTHTYMGTHILVLVKAHMLWQTRPNNQPALRPSSTFKCLTRWRVSCSCVCVRPFAVTFRLLN